MIHKLLGCLVMLAFIVHTTFIVHTNSESIWPKLDNFQLNNYNKNISAFSTMDL